MIHSIESNSYKSQRAVVSKVTRGKIGNTITKKYYL